MIHSQHNVFHMCTHILDQFFVWPSWKKYSTKYIQYDDMKDYMRKVFAQKYSNTSSYDGWSLELTLGLTGSYVGF